MVLDPVAALLGGDKLGHRGRGPSGRRARRAVAGALDLQVVDRRSRSANSGGPEQLRRRRSKERPFSRDVWGGSTAAGFNDQHLAVYLVEVTGAGRVQRRAARGGAVHKSEGTDPSPPRGGRGNSRLDRLTEEPLSDPAAPSSRRLDRLERGAGALLRRAAPARCPGALPRGPRRCASCRSLRGRGRSAMAAAPSAPQPGATVQRSGTHRAPRRVVHPLCVPGRRSCPEGPQRSVVLRSKDLYSCTYYPVQ